MGVGAEVVTGDARSKRSPIDEVAAGGGGDLVAVGAAEVKSPKSPNPPDVLRVTGFGCGGGFVFATGVGLLSKKLPPARLEVGEAIEERGDAKLANAFGFAACWVDGEAKLKPPNASPRPERD